MQTSATTTDTSPVDNLGPVRQGLIATILKGAGVPADRRESIRRSADRMEYLDLEFAAKAAHHGYVSWDGDRLVVNPDMCQLGQRPLRSGTHDTMD